MPSLSRLVTAAAAARPTKESSVCAYSFEGTAAGPRGAAADGDVRVLSHEQRLRPRSSRARQLVDADQYSVGKMKAPITMPCLLGADVDAAVASAPRRAGATALLSHGCRPPAPGRRPACRGPALTWQEALPRMTPSARPAPQDP